MSKLTFIQDNVITQMISADGEVIDFVTSITTKEVNVESWMSAVETQMREAVRDEEIQIRFIIIFPSKQNSFFLIFLMSISLLVSRPQ